MITLETQQHWAYWLTGQGANAAGQQWTIEKLAILENSILAALEAYWPEEVQVASSSVCSRDRHRRSVLAAGASPSGFPSQGYFITLPFMQHERCW